MSTQLSILEKNLNQLHIYLCNDNYNKYLSRKH